MSGWQNIFISVPLICAGYSKVRRVPLSTNTSQPNVSLLPNHTYLRGIPSQMPASARFRGLQQFPEIFYKGSGYFPEKIRSVFCVKKPCLRSSKGQPLAYLTRGQSNCYADRVIFFCGTRGIPLFTQHTYGSTAPDFQFLHLNRFSVLLSFLHRSPSFP